MQQVSSDIVLVRVYQPEALADLRRQFREAIASFPEYCDGASRSILGGFGAFGVPSSFHGAFARQLRQAVNGPGERALHSLMAPDEYIHQLYDRIRYRPAGVTFSGESWHRDVASSHLSILPDDAIYGGFVNFNDYPVLRIAEMPKVEVHIVKSTEKPGGIGEPGTPPVAPAVANAIFGGHATALVLPSSARAPAWTASSERARVESMYFMWIPSV